MQIKTDVPETEALTIGKSAAALGIHEFSLLARAQAGDIIVARLWSGEMAIPISELERLAKLSIYSLPVSSAKPESVLPDDRLGVKRESDSGLKLTESEKRGYRAAFGVIAGEFESLVALRHQLENPATVKPSPEKEIVTSQLGVWQVRATLLNLGTSDILLCQKADSMAVIERFDARAPYAKANGAAEILLERNDSRELAAAFNANAKHTLEFMASNQVATAQRIIWSQYQGQHPERLVAAISERCRLAVIADEAETVSPAQKMEPPDTNRHSRGRGMSI